MFKLSMFLCMMVSNFLVYSSDDYTTPRRRPTITAEHTNAPVKQRPVVYFTPADIASLEKEERALFDRMAAERERMIKAIRECNEKIANFNIH